MVIQQGAAAADLRSALKSQDSNAKQRSVSFTEAVKGEVKDEWLTKEQKNMLKSIKSMLVSESSFHDNQQKALKTMRSVMMGGRSTSAEGEEAAKERMLQEDAQTLLVYSLACHLSHQSVAMGIDPGSLLKTFTYFTSQSLTQQGSDQDMSFLLPYTPTVDEKSLRRIWSPSTPVKVEVGTDLAHCVQWLRRMQYCLK